MQTTAPATPLVAALREFVDARVESIMAARKQLGISDIDARAVLFIAMNPGTSPGELRANLGVTSAGITTLVDRLIERDAVRREAHPGDRRMIQLFVTVDLDSAPWDALIGFDERVARAADGLSTTEAGTATVAIEELTRAGRG